jgi:dTDP-4-amino-4,6-dideoxygalactose transaminase
MLTTSCTDALEMAAILIDVREGDEVIMPSFTFVSTANAFCLRKAKIVFADSSENHPNMDANQIEKLISNKTKAIVVVHYAGVANEMDKIMDLARKHGLFVIEDAAQAIDAYYHETPLGSMGDLAAFSFHETKNIISGEGGMLVVNNEQFLERAEIIWEKGTNRSAFYRGEIDKYGWVDLGSSFLPSDLIAAFLYAQFENMEEIQRKRKEIWETYYASFAKLEQEGLLKLPKIPSFGTNNAHMFYLLCRSNEERSALITYLKQRDILAVFHYLPLHISKYFVSQHDGRTLNHVEYFSDHLLRLPIYYELSSEQQNRVIQNIYGFFNLPYQEVDG